MHKTNTVDYAIVFDGEMWLELDDAKTIHLKKGESSSRTHSARLAKQRQRTGDDVVLSKRRESVTPARKQIPRPISEEVKPDESGHCSWRCIPRL